MKYILVFLILSYLAFSGVKITSQNTIMLESGNQTQSSIMYVDKAFLKIDESDGKNKISVIYDKSKQLMFMLNHTSKTYLTISKSDMIELAKQKKEQIKKIESEISKMPKEQKAYYSELLKKQKEAINPDKLKLKYAKQKSTEKIEKWNCIYYKATKNKELIKELWTAEYSDFGLEKSDFDIIGEFAKFNQTAASDIQKQFGFSAGNEEKKEYSGYPIKQIIYVNKKKVGQSLVKNIEIEKFDDAFFKVPSDFKKQAIPTSK